MKITKIILAFVLLFAINSSSAYRRGGDTRISLGLEGASPAGDFSDQSGFGFGGTFRVESAVGDNGGFLFTLGYLSFPGKDQTINGFTFLGSSQSVFPAQLGFKYYFKDIQDGFYVEAQVGTHMFLIPAVSVNGFDLKSSTKFFISYAPGVGYHLDSFDFSLRFQMIAASHDVVGLYSTETIKTTYEYVGIRAAYVFGGD